MKPNTIYFYDTESDIVKKEHIFLNNFETSEFIADDDFRYKTVEHYYQAHKFEEFKDAFEEVRSAKDPGLCKNLARENQKELNWNNEKWENGFKDYIMGRGLCYKFSQNKDMLKKLVETGSARLVEASERDPYWGGVLPNSKNMLGLMLEELRENYKKSNKVYIEGCELEPIEINFD
jgi:ribA/ribD-fused uncharacterized protein